MQCFQESDPPRVVKVCLSPWPSECNKGVVLSPCSPPRIFPHVVGGSLLRVWSTLFLLGSTQSKPGSRGRYIHTWRGHMGKGAVAGSTLGPNCWATIRVIVTSPRRPPRSPEPSICLAERRHPAHLDSFRRHIGVRQTFCHTWTGPA